MTHKQIAELVTRETGYPVSKTSVSAALHRAGYTKSAKKYPDEIPWTVKDQHQTHYAVRMLRLLGRRNAGIRNSEEQDARLDAWLGKLEASDAVVTYFPDTEDGFFYVHATPDAPGVPVRRDYKVM